ncbi:MAG: hypothetical protein NC342_05240 [Pseudoflavonifractor sp.]|nr:hypothetical protein [Alloprevotella sp.]MCM1116921.1 hypothetical protein [Pseudoflavonifractor sp.]
MRHILIYILIAAATAMAGGCSKADHFTIDGETQGDEPLTMMWHDGSQMHETHLAPLDGSFRIKGSAPDYALVWLMDESERPLVSVIARDGDHLRVEIDRNEPLNSRARGNDVTEQLDAWIHDNAPALATMDASAINAAVEAFIAENPSSPASTALLTNYFRSMGSEATADSLLRLLQPEARSKALLGSWPALLASRLTLDASGTIGPRSLPGPKGKRIRLYPRDATLTLIAFGTPQGRREADSAVATLRDLTTRYPRRRLQALEVSSYADSSTWAMNVAADTAAAWDITWTPGATADRQWRNYAIPTLPYFIIADSTGTQRLHTASASEASRYITRLLGADK